MHSIDNGVLLGKPCGGSSMSAKAIGGLVTASGSSAQGPGQGAVVAGVGSVNTLSWGSAAGGYGVKRPGFRHAHVVGPWLRPALAHGRCTDPGCCCALL